MVLKPRCTGERQQKKALAQEGLIFRAECEITSTKPIYSPGCGR